jgi:DNA recombination protein RmuC
MLIPWLLFFLGLLLGAIIAWLYAKSRYGAEAVSSGNLLQRETSRLAQAESHTAELQRELLEQNALRSSLETELRTRNEWIQEQKNHLQEVQKQMEVRFRQLASASLEEQSLRFSEQQQSKLFDTLTPFRNELESFRKQVDEKFRGEAEGRGELKGELNKMLALNQTISRQTEQLSTALSKQSRAQGSYGEDVLETILGNAGFIEGEHFLKQYSTQNAVGERIRPDIILRRPQGPPIVVDSKVSLTHYVRYCEAVQDPQQERVLAKEVYQSFKAHIEGLSGKRYDSIEGHSDFVLLFTPVENAFTVATNYDPALREFAYARNIFVVTPSSLLLVVRMLSELWQKERLSKEILDVAEQARKLYEKACGFVESFQAAGNALSKASSEWERASSRLQGHGGLLRQGQKLGKMIGGRTDKEMPGESLVD